MDRDRPLHSIPDDELLRRLSDLLRQSRHDEADLVAHIGEVDQRRLYRRAASPSMFVYCTEVLHLSEAEAYLRITAARAAREHPVLLEMLRDGRLHLSGIAKLVPHLNGENALALLRRAAHRSKRQILELIAEVAPRPDVAATIRRLPERHPSAPASPGVAVCAASAGMASTGVSLGTTSAAPISAGLPQGITKGAGSEASLAGAASGEEAIPCGGELRPDRVAPRPSALTPQAAMEPLAPGRYRVQFTANARLREKLERLQALMRGRVPAADLATIIEAAVTEKLERLDAKRFAAVKTPRRDLRGTRTTPTSRHIPAAAKRAVHERDGGRCGYRDEEGRRCPERARLEFHHHYPFGRGGDHSPKNVGLLCGAHNLLLAEHDYGRGPMARHRGSNQRLRPPARWT